MNCRRKPLEQIDYTKTTHVGLWLNKFLKEQIPKGKKFEKGQDSPYQMLVNQCSQIEQPPEYERFFKNWIFTLDCLGAQMRKVKAQGRLAIGLGNESSIETSLSVHHTYGVPYIPGSALKGLASSYAHQYLGEPWQKKSQAHSMLFGTPDSTGLVTFFDALPLPQTQNDQNYPNNILPDIITVHHPKYYQGQNISPSDFDGPTPIPFLSVIGTYLIALHSPTGFAWTDAGYNILELALEEIGVGAKTNSGYGRMKLGDPVKELTSGTLFRATVQKIEGGYLELELETEFDLGVPKHKELYAYMEEAQVTHRQLNVDGKIWVIIEEIIPDEEELVIKCRPATKAERNVNRK